MNEVNLQKSWRLQLAQRLNLWASNPPPLCPSIHTIYRNTCNAYGLITLPLREGKIFCKKILGGGIYILYSGGWLAIIAILLIILILEITFKGLKPLHFIKILVKLTGSSPSPCGRVKFSARKFWEGLETKSRNSLFVKFFLLVNASSISSKRTRPRDCVAFGSWSRYLLKIAV